MSQDNRRWIRRVRPWGLGLLVVLAALYVLVKFWLAPSFIKDQIRQRSAKYWDGPVEVADVEFNVLGPIRMTGLTFKDAAWHPWVTVTSADVFLARSGWRPVVDHVQAHSVDFQVFADDHGKVAPPWKSLAMRSMTQDKFISLQAFLAKQLKVNLTQGRTSTQLGSYSAEAWKEGETWQFRVVGEHTPLSITGQISTSSDSTIGLTKCVLGDPNGPLSQEFDFAIAYDRSELNTSFAIHMADGKGQLEGNCHADFGAKNMTYEINLKARDVDLSMPARLMKGSLARMAGGLSGQVRMTGTGTDIGNMTAKGQFRVKDADLTISKVVRGVLDYLNIPAADPIRRSNIDVEFTVGGATLSLVRGKIKNPLSSFEIEPGGRVDLRTAKLDLNVVVARLEQLRRLLGSMPLCSTGAELLGAASRVKVTCRGDNPKTLEIIPLPPPPAATSRATTAP